MNLNNVLFQVEAGSKVDAIHRLMEDGYRLSEATNIRRWLPLHFLPIWPAEPVDNYDFWKAYRSVKDAMSHPTSQFRFGFVNSYPGKTFNFSDDDRVTYTSPTYSATFKSLEFIRHFGDGIWCTPADNIYAFSNLGYFRKGVFRTRRTQMVHCLKVVESRMANPSADGYIVSPREGFVSATEAVSGYFKIAAATLCRAMGTPLNKSGVISIDMLVGMVRVVNNFHDQGKVVDTINSVPYQTALNELIENGFSLIPVFSDIKLPRINMSQPSNVYTLEIPMFESKGFTMKEWSKAYRKIFG